MKPALALLMIFGAAATNAQQPWEVERDRQDQERWNEQARQSAQLEATLRREPALPPARNPLLGRWALPSVNKGNPNDPISMLGSAFGVLNCGSDLAGASQLEFLPDRMVKVAGDGERTETAVDYRGRPNGVFVVGPYQPLMFFQFLDRDRIQLGQLPECRLGRMGAAESASTRAAQAPASNAARPAVASAVSGISHVADGAAFRCADAKLVVVKFCEGGSDGYCQIWTARDRHLPDEGWTPAASRSEIATRVQSCERGTVSIDANSIVTFAPGS